MSNDEIEGYREFEFDLPTALLDSLIVTLDNMHAGTLERRSLICYLMLRVCINYYMRATWYTLARPMRKQA